MLVWGVQNEKTNMLLAISCIQGSKIFGIDIEFMESFTGSIMVWWFVNSTLKSVFTMGTGKMNWLKIVTYNCLVHCGFTFFFFFSSTVFFFLLLFVFSFTMFARDADLVYAIRKWFLNTHMLISSEKGNNKKIW